MIKHIEFVQKSSINLYSDLAKWVVATPDAAAIVTPQKTLSYQDLDKEVFKYVKLLCERGVTAGARVALEMSQEIRAVFIFLALARLGATALSFPRSATATQKQRWLDEAGIDILVSDSEYQHLQWASDRRGINLIIFNPITEEDRFDDYGEAVPFIEQLTIAPLMIVVGSGSTGRSKLLPLTHDLMRGRANALCDVYRLTTSDRIATMAHIEYATGVHRLWNALIGGAAFVLFDRTEFSLSDLRRKLGVTILTATVFHAQRMLTASKAGAAYPLDGVRLVLSSSIVSDDLREQITKHLCRDLWVAYGTNETWSVTTAGSDSCLTYPGTIGLPIRGVEVAIVDEAFLPVADGVAGHIAIKSQQTIAGYLDDTEATQLAFRNGWFLPGDLGKRTSDGHIIFCGRADNMMIFNGINIYPIEIEQCLLGHPDVADAVATPMRHPVHQDLPVAVVSLRPGVAFDEEQLQSFAARNLGVKRPRRIFFAPTIPRNVQGKPIKSALQKIISEGHLSGAPSLKHQVAPELLRIKFPWSESFRASMLEPWLDILDPSVAAVRASPARAEEEASEQEHVLRWTEQTLKLAMALLHVLRQPFFGSLPVLKCGRVAEGSNEWVVTSRLPDVNLVSREVMTGLIQVALRLAMDICQTSPARAEEREKYFSRIEEVLKPFARIVPNGKSTFEILKRAHGLGIPFRRRSGEVFQLGWGRHSVCLDRSVTLGDSSVGMRVASNKITCALWLRQAGLPAPRHQLAPNLEAARTVALDLGFPVVVKPADLERGEGVSVDVGADGLERAYEEALRLSPRKQVIVEEQVHGVCHRLFVAAGQLLYAVKRLPIGLYGDGVSSVADLVTAQSQTQMQLPPWRRSGRFELDDQALDEMRRQGYAPQDVPAAGCFIALRRIETTAWGGVDEDVTQVVHPENLKAAISAAALLGLEVAGVDIISHDISRPWFDNDAVINEVNFAPLLGGGEISRRYITEFLSRWMPERGRIPVHVYVGGDGAWKEACAHQTRLLSEGAATYVTSESLTLDSQGEALQLACHGLHARVQAILMRTEVASLIIVLQSIEVLSGGPPVDKVSTLQWVDQDVKIAATPSSPSAPLHALEQLRNACHIWWPDQPRYSNL